MLDLASCPMCQSTNRTINGLSTPEFWCCLDCGHLFGAQTPADRAMQAFINHVEHDFLYDTSTSTDKPVGFLNSRKGRK